MRRVRTRWFAAAIVTTACAVLVSCTSAAAEPPKPSATQVALLPTEAERAWERTGLPADQRPRVEPLRVVSIFERPEAVAACLRTVGYPHAVVAHGRVEAGDVPEARQPSLALSTYLCEAQYPADPLFDRPLSLDQVRTLHRYRATVQRDCLQDLGHAIALPPTERAFVEGYAEHGGWNPMNNVAAFGFAEAEAACPAVPPELAETAAPPAS